MIVVVRMPAIISLNKFVHQTFCGFVDGGDEETASSRAFASDGRRASFHKTERNFDFGELGDAFLDEAIRDGAQGFSTVEIVQLQNILFDGFERSVEFVLIQEIPNV